jgi:carbon storage regulator
MLVLTRKKGEAIIIGDQIELVILDTTGDTVRIGIKAPSDVQVYRKELYLSIQQSNKEAASNPILPSDLGKIYRKTEK